MVDRDDTYLTLRYGIAQYTKGAVNLWPRGRRKKRMRPINGRRREILEAEEADKVEVAPGGTVASLRRFRAALIVVGGGGGVVFFTLLTDRASTIPSSILDQPEDSLSDVDCAVRESCNPASTECGRCYAFGCMVAIRGGYRMARDWHYTKLSLSSAPLLYFSGIVYIIDRCILLLFLSFCRFSSCFVVFFALVGAL